MSSGPSSTREEGGDSGEAQVGLKQEDADGKGGQLSE